MIYFIIDNKAFEKKYYVLVSNVHDIVREARHADCSDAIKFETSMIHRNLVRIPGMFEHAITPAEDWDLESHSMRQLLDLMDYLKDKYLDNSTFAKNKKSYDYRVINSIYDCIKEFYFEN